MKVELDKIGDAVSNFKTEHEFGFNPQEIKEILKKFPNTNMEKFQSALFGNTCMINVKGEIIIYPCDVKLALRCGKDCRDPLIHEWD